MQLRYRADLRTLLWVAAMPIVALSMYFQPGWIPFAMPVSCYLALAAGVIAHNHNHCPTFMDRQSNNVFAIFISIFYGYPTFAWVPTHNLNHHRLVNKAGDATITWRHTNRHNFLVAGTYFFVSSYWQSDPIKAYIRKARENNPSLFRRIVIQYVAWAGSHLALLALAVGMHGFRLGALVWACAFGIPAFFALWTIMFFNYVQHVHADPWSAHNHSRSFTGRMVNFLLFNNGLHAAHHENASLHWSLLPAAHHLIHDQIEPSLRPVSFWWWCIRSYILAPFIPSFGTRQVGRAPFDVPEGSLDLTSQDVDAAEPGVNLAMV